MSSTSTSKRFSKVSSRHAIQFSGKLNCSMAINNIIKKLTLSFSTSVRWLRKYLLGKKAHSKTLVTNHWLIWSISLICYTVRIIWEEPVRAIWSLEPSLRHSKSTLICELSNICYSQKTSSVKLFSNKEMKTLWISRV